MILEDIELNMIWLFIKYAIMKYGQSQSDLLNEYLD